MTLKEHIGYLVRWAPTWTWFVFAFAVVTCNIVVGVMR